MHTISKFYIELNAHELALYYAEKSMKMMKKTAGDNNRETAICISNLSEV